MHDCRRFREDWVAGEAGDFGDCRECRAFCEDAQLVLQAADAAQPIPELAEAYWDGFETRLRASLLRENDSRSYRVYWKWSAALTAAATIVLVFTWGTMRTVNPTTDEAQGTPRIEFNDDHIRGLDPMVVAFLGQSELFLRNFTKIESSYVEDLDDARARAKQSLTEIEEQKQLAGGVAPVRIVLDEYENVLREIKNFDSTGDLADIQTRIRGSGLIANMSAYQPQAVLVSQR